MNEFLRIRTEIYQNLSGWIWRRNFLRFRLPRNLVRWAGSGVCGLPWVWPALCSGVVKTPALVRRRCHGGGPQPVFVWFAHHWLSLFNDGIKWECESKIILMVVLALLLGDLRWCHAYAWKAYAEDCPESHLVCSAGVVVCLWCAASLCAALRGSRFVQSGLAPIPKF